jgi:peptide chain release factor
VRYAGGMTLFGVTPQKEAALRCRMEGCGLREGDLEERFITGGGPGGQHVNRSATTVYLKHKPTGLEVKMGKERSQALNRFFARRRMCELLEAQDPERPAPRVTKAEKVRKQKSRRKRKTRKKLATSEEE